MPKRAQDNLGRRARMTSKGQVTIPKAIRKQLKLETGVTLHFWVEGAPRGGVWPRPRRGDALIGRLPKPERALSIEEINEGVAEAAVERAAT